MSGAAWRIIDNDFIMLSKAVEIFSNHFDFE